MEEQQSQQPQQKVSWHAIKSAAALLSTEEIVNFLVHSGNMSAAGAVEMALFGGLGAILVGWNLPPALQWLKDNMPQGEEMEPFRLLTHREPGKRSLMDRLLDRFPGEDGETEEDRGVESPSEEETRQEQEAASDSPSPRLPHAPSFRDMCHLLGGERLILCYTVDGPLYGTLLDLLSMAVVGKPGRGKTTALMYYVSILLKAGAEVVVWDPHGVMGPLALLNGQVLTNMPKTARITYMDRKEEMFASVGTLTAALAKRDERYRWCQMHEKPFDMHPLVLLADELPLLAEFDDEAEKENKERNREHRANKEPIETFSSMTDIMKRFVLEARKWDCYFIGSGQSTDAEILPTRLTENLSSRIIFYSSDRRARMAGLEQDDIKNLLPVLKHANPGTMIFDCSRMSQAILAAIPHIEIADLRAFLGVSSASILPGRHQVEQEQRILPDTEKLAVRMRDYAPSHSQSLNPALQMAYDLFQQYPNMNHHQLAKQLGILPAAAGRIIRQLQQHGAIRQTEVRLSLSSTGQIAENRSAHGEPLKLSSHENENRMKGPVEARESLGSLNENFMASHEDEVAVLLAVVQMKNEGINVTREAIKQRLGWNNAKHPVVKSVCDKHKIAVR